MIKHEENIKHSKYESEIKQTLAHVQSMLNVRQISIEHEVVIITGYKQYIRPDPLYRSLVALLG